MNQYQLDVQTIEKWLPIKKTASKARLDIARQVTSAIHESGLTPQDLMTAYQNDAILDVDVYVKNTKDFFTAVKDPKFDTLVRVLFTARPVGLGTPNAATGEGELVAVICSPRADVSKKSSEGDLLINGKKVELKGDQLRIMAPSGIAGNKLNQHGKSLLSKYQLNENSCKNGLGVEPWSIDPKPSYSKKGKLINNDKYKRQAHWRNEFNRIGEKLAKEFLKEYLDATMDHPFSTSDFDPCFTNGQYDGSKLFEVLILNWFDNFIAKSKWDCFTVISNGNVRVIKDHQTFQAFIKNKSNYQKLDNYFRIFQSNTVGIYVLM